LLPVILPNAALVFLSIFFSFLSSNNRGINNGRDLPEDFLLDVYARITLDEIRMKADNTATFFPLASKKGFLQMKSKVRSPITRAACEELHLASDHGAVVGEALLVHPGRSTIVLVQECQRLVSGPSYLLFFFFFFFFCN
jgi:hypothetical protein